MTSKKLTDYEKAVVDHLEGDAPESVTNLSAKKERYQSIATDQIKKRRKINLNVLEADIERVKIKAIAQGLPYQTLIASVIHQFATDKLEPTKQD
jgi:predicted DNA binding CopG/RHH family protein